MRIYKSHAVLSRKETALWGAGTSDAGAMARGLRDRLAAYLERTGKRKIELYSSLRAGGWVACVVYARGVV